MPESQLGVAHVPRIQPVCILQDICGYAELYADIHWHVDAGLKHLLVMGRKDV